MKTNKVGTLLTFEEMEIINHIAAGRTILLNAVVDGDIRAKPGCYLGNNSINGGIKIVSGEEFDDLFDNGERGRL
ncbi:hypothetical protein [Leuconostoc mesenteroides]|uniref:Uncharacterized protein n=1 Tax=Leuconostoc mesenteroides TaxID=1245 RepID=A0A843Z1W6_LEUME|nr:hypothetical protein [Leuconostoc mesenteroides]MBZ1522425.1 hypothetical protein [Leuconostoc mesenteroides]MCM6832150.1 hypothetical protein [Leuconostoc mesenteroides]MDP0487061.1 hypothetical protein [Leuconostoc mesenteroides]MQR27314.1 hypothetical protein [Leuconostoc mesenteroides]WMS39012.1 hypothetical protein Q8F54_06240 [Leuconostoc mesenteroides]